MNTQLYEKESPTQAEGFINIYKKISLIMQEVCLVAKREKSNGMVYDFVSHDDVSELIHEPMARIGVVVLPDVVEYKIDQNKHFVRVLVTFVNADNPLDSFALQAHGFAIDSQDKGYGKALSYAMKYVYLKLFVLQSGSVDEVEAYQDAKKLTFEEPKQRIEKPKAAVMPWGKHKDVLLSELPQQYVDWLQSSGTLDKPEAKDLLDELKKIGRI